MSRAVRGGLVLLMCACTGPNRAGSFSGSVTLDGSPLMGATVELIGRVVNHEVPQTTPFLEIDPPLAVTETGPDGSYRLEARLPTKQKDGPRRVQRYRVLHDGTRQLVLITQWREGARDLERGPEAIVASIRLD